jgi:hypothetical protein
VGDVPRFTLTPPLSGGGYSQPWSGGGVAGGPSDGVSMVPNVPSGTEPQINLGSGIGPMPSDPGFTIHGGYSASADAGEALVATVGAQAIPKAPAVPLSGGAVAEGIFISPNPFNFDVGFYRRIEARWGLGRSAGTGAEGGVYYKDSSGASTGVYAEFSGGTKITGVSATKGGATVDIPLTGPAVGASGGVVYSQTDTISLGALIFRCVIP